MFCRFSWDCLSKYCYVYTNLNCSKLYKYLELLGIGLIVDVVFFVTGFVFVSEVSVSVTKVESVEGWGVNVCLVVLGFVFLAVCVEVSGCCVSVTE